MAAILDYSLTATGAAAFEAVSTDELKAQARVLHASDDTLLERLAKAAREQVEKDTGLALVERTWRQTHDQPPSDDFLLLRRRPVQSIESITYQDADDAQQTWAAANYELDAGRGAVLLAYDASWPTTRSGRRTFSINFTAGYSSAAEVPELARQAILLLAAHWYAHPEAEVLGTITSELKQGYERIVRLLMEGRYP